MVNITLTRFCVLEHHGGCQCTCPQTRCQDLEVSHQRTKIAVVGRGESVDGRLLEIDAFFAKDAACDAAKCFIAGSNEVDFEQVPAETISRAPPRGALAPQPHFFVAGKNDRLFGLVEQPQQVLLCPRIAGQRRAWTLVIVVHRTFNAFLTDLA